MAAANDGMNSVPAHRTAVSIVAPAKLTLSLRVTGVRPEIGRAHV